MATLGLRFAAFMVFAMALPAHANELEGVWLFQKELNTTETTFTSTPQGACI